jgi:hypothetical protein
VDLGHRGGGDGDPARPVGLAPVRVRGQERAVGLQDQLVQRHDGAGGALVGGVAEGDGARERHHPAGFDDPLGHGGVAGEAVEDHPLGGADPVQDVEDVVEGVAAVDDEGLVEAPGQLGVGGEGAPLDLGRSVVAVVVQARLPGRDDLRPGQQHLERRQRRRRRLGGRVRVDPGRGRDGRDPGRVGRRHLAGGQVDADVDHVADAGRARLGDQLLGAGAEQVQVAVGVDQHVGGGAQTVTAPVSAPETWAAYLARAPRV